MRQIYTSPRNENIDRVVALLAEAGIETSVTNRSNYGGHDYMGPSYTAKVDSSTWPQVWIVHSDDQTRARALLREIGIEPATRFAAEIAEATTKEQTASQRRVKLIWNVRTLLLAADNPDRHSQLARRAASLLAREQKPGLRRAAVIDRSLHRPEVTMPRNRTAFLFDLDGTLVDSVYQHVLAWKASLDAEGIPLSVWRIHRKIGMSGGLFANILLRETGFDNTPERLERLRHHSRRGVQGTLRQRAPVAGRPGTARLPRRAEAALGDRDERAHGNRAAQSRRARRRPEQGAGRHARSGQVCQARSRPVPDRGRSARRRHPQLARRSATASGT